MDEQRIAEMFAEHILEYHTKGKLKKDKATLQQIKDYIEEKNYNVDPEGFYATMEAKKWMRTAKEPVLSWKGTVYKYHVGGWIPRKKKYIKPTDAPCTRCGKRSAIILGNKPWCSSDCERKYTEENIRIR